MHEEKHEKGTGHDQFTRDIWAKEVINDSSKHGVDLVWSGCPDPTRY